MLFVLHFLVQLIRYIEFISDAFIFIHLCKVCIHSCNDATMDMVNKNVTVVDSVLILDIIDKL